MKKLQSLTIAFALMAAASVTSFAQSSAFRLPGANARAIRPFAVEAGKSAASNATKPMVASIFHSNPLSPTIALPSGQDMLPMSGWWTQQSNGRALHNIQVDPLHPNNIHVVVTGNTTFNVDDTVNAASRVCYYCFSSDGGHTWGTPVVLQPSGSTFQRQGYADLVLMNRNNEYVPVIMCHRYWPAGRQEVYTTLYIEKGHAGEGNFSQSLYSNVVRTTADGTTGDVIWPSIALSPDSKTVYAIASLSPGTVEELQFGKFTLNETRDSAASFSGWISKPGDYNGTPNLGLTFGGDYRMYVSPSGRIGVAWECLPSQSFNYPVEDPTWGLFYSESNDGGVTWSETPVQISAISDEQDASGMQMRPNGAFDFWFDGPGDTAKFVYVKYAQDLQNSGTANTGGRPSSTVMFFRSLSRSDSTLIVSTDSTADYTSPQYVPNVFQFRNDLGVDLVNIELLEFPTVALTSDPKRLAVFYVTYMTGDHAEISDNDAGADTLVTRNYEFGSIFYSETKDGGWTWSSPQPFLTNANNSTPIDYRYPQTSRWNQIVGGQAHYEVLFSADSAPGWVYQNGTVPGFGLIYYGHATAVGSVAGVHDGAGVSNGSITMQPNPFVTTATVTVNSPTAGTMHLVVRDALGRELHRFAPQMVGEGRSMSFELDARSMHLTPGVYFVTATCGDTELTHQAVLVK